jgi:hypothetical protein
MARNCWSESGHDADRQKNNRPPFAGRQALTAVHHIEGRSLAAFPAGPRQPGHPSISERPHAEVDSSEVAPHRADR